LEGVGEQHFGPGVEAFQEAAPVHRQREFPDDRFCERRRINRTALEFTH
jgi:hypothetical protein